MRILYDAHQERFKTPFGTLRPKEVCTLHLYIPTSVPAVSAECVICRENGAEFFCVPMHCSHREGLYAIFRGEFSFDAPGLFFYYFRIHKPDSSFRLFKQGHNTNMEYGDCWQVSCIPADFVTPDWAKGAVIYQIFPDRFAKSGECDLSEKLQPYILHSRWEEEIRWQRDPQGKSHNNDFFGGNFRGIMEKLPHLAALGVGIIYLNPICKSFSNHRYDTADYKTPDPMLGTQQDFADLCEAAHAYGMHIVLDGVFSHTGANSLYFDKQGNFGKVGAYWDKNSPYYSWYCFHEHPDRYTCWWGFDSLPTVDKNNPAFIDYIIDSEDSVIAHWLKLGADGFRLDVADELPDSFILRLKNRLRQLKPDALLMGEVWEDASYKLAYNVRKRYFVDGELDSCMNYPFRTAILEFMRGMDDGRSFRERVMTILENYPTQVVHCNMNLLGSHDTPRILTALVDSFDGPREVLAERFLSGRQRKLAETRLMVASFLQFTLPGAPSIYYGDEAGMEGGKDPFCRRTYPWGKENPVLLAHYRQLGQLRRTEKALRMGKTEFSYAAGGLIHFIRESEDSKLHIYVNRSADSWDIAPGEVLYSVNITHKRPGLLRLAPMGFCITREK
ncbi:MAG: glycoside hydrolase family 13 protein [Ruminococcaceae bacterium]|nr:glycoside hydrolase family 13 protein [Oscillospiraceae bacterium]